MKYILNSYGWEGEFICKSLTPEQTQIIDKLKEDSGAEDYSQIRFEIEDYMTFDIWDGDILHKTNPLNNGGCYFELMDENEKVLFEFTIDDISLNDNDVEYNISSEEGKDIYVSIDESKGGIFSYEFDSDVEPVVSDFTWTEGLIFLPNQEFWSIVDSIEFKGEVLEPYDHLDNYGKSATLHIFKK